MVYSPAMRVQVRYSGRVQGVGFRAAMRSIVAKYPVVGWVRNEPDGTVLAEVQGGKPAIDTLLADVRAEMGRFIRSELVNDVPDRSDEHSFEIRR